jgi:undecaprenyl-diphosphatase
MALGLIQGLTEFLPVSSSGHLVIFEKIFGVKPDDLVFEVLVHFGTLIAVVIYFRERLRRIFISVFNAAKSEDDRAHTKLGWFLVLGTIPAVVIGLILKSQVELAFASPRWASGMLIVTAVILLLTRWTKREDGRLNWARSLLIGMAQALAIMPGISRSGATIATGMFARMKKSESAEFSFLLSVPAIAGATIMQLPDFLADVGDARLMINYLAGAGVAALVGYLSIALLMNIVKKGKFFYFGLYCAAAGFLGIILL